MLSIRYGFHSHLLLNSSSVALLVIKSSASLYVETTSCLSVWSDTGKQSHRTWSQHLLFEDNRMKRWLGDATRDSHWRSDLHHCIRSDSHFTYFDVMMTITSRQFHMRINNSYISFSSEKKKWTLLLLFSGLQTSREWFSQRLCSWVTGSQTTCCIELQFRELRLEFSSLYKPFAFAGISYSFPLILDRFWPEDARTTTSSEETSIPCHVVHEEKEES